ncbi:hypothetical protein CK214_28030 [Mesorhizobium sp. WSM3882]|nr:hypothetical protein CK214_28030 [Mesorhizobium sp. WSM3882]
MSSFHGLSSREVVASHSALYSLIVSAKMNDIDPQARLAASAGEVARPTLRVRGLLGPSRS